MKLLFIFKNFIKDYQYKRELKKQIILLKSALWEFGGYMNPPEIVNQGVTKKLDRF